MPNDTYIRST